MKITGWKSFAVMALLLGLFFAGRYLYFKPKFGVGTQAPAFHAKLLDGTEFELSALEGRFVLLEFWGSWCGPCRRENPRLVKAYNTINGKRSEDRPFEIVSIGVETDSSSWLKAIKQDGLDWPYHISTTKRFRDPIVMKYGVREIPTGYLINPEGRIMAVNPSAEKLIDMVSSRLD